MRRVRRVSPGQPRRLSAEEFNTIAIAANDYLDRRHGGGAPGPPPIAPRDVVLVRNDSGGDVGLFGVLGIDEPLIDDGADLAQFQSRVALSGSTPVADEHAGRFAVLLEPIADGHIGRAALTGAVCVQLTIDADDPSRTTADVGVGTGGLLQQTGGSAEILWRAAGDTGTVWAIVRLGTGGRVSQGVARTEIMAPRHYSGDNTVEFWTVGSCLNSIIVPHFDLRECSGNGASADHPAGQDPESFEAQQSRIHTERLGTYAAQWDPIWFWFVDATGTGQFNYNPCSGEKAFWIEWLLGDDGALTWRLHRVTSSPIVVSLVIRGYLTVVPIGEAPGVVEIGNCCCHDDPDWDSYEWGEHPDNPL